VVVSAVGSVVGSVAASTVASEEVNVGVVLASGGAESRAAGVVDAVSHVSTSI